MQKRAALGRPGHDVRPLGELVVLERLVQPDLESQAPEVRGLHLAHRGMHRIRRAPAAPVATSWVDELEVGLEPKSVAESDVRVERADLARLDCLSCPERDARQRCHPSQGESPTPALAVDGQPQGGADPR